MTAARDISGAHAAQGFTDELKPGTELLRGQYVIERFLNSGGFGLTYLARDSLDRTVVIKECFPGTLCGRSNLVVRARSRTQQDEFRSVVRMFVQEARRLARLRHPSIVGVHQVFEDNETAYMALDYVEGQDLLDIVEGEPDRLGPAELVDILKKLLDAISYVHDEAILHRDIAPDNILLDRSGNPVLIDFGAARERATRASRALSALQVVKDGYSPQEFYVAGSKQGPAGDLYALGATFYHLISGAPPPNSQARLAAVASQEADPCVPLAGRFRDYEPEFLAAVDRALAVFPKDRPQSAREWLQAIDARRRREAAKARARLDRTIEVSISRMVAETNRAVEEARQREALRARESQVAVSEPAPRPRVDLRLDDEEDDGLILSDSDGASLRIAPWECPLPPELRPLGAAGPGDTAPDQAGGKRQWGGGLFRRLSRIVPFRRRDRHSQTGEA